MTTLYYIIGEPGCGKTTLMAALTNHLHPVVGDDTQAWNKQVHKVPYIMLYRDPEFKGDPAVACEIGVRREKHGGTDALGMHMSPVIALWLSKFKKGTFLGEGDRLGNRTFFARVTATGVQVCVIHLYGSPDILSKRRAQRGTEQDETWIAGRRSMSNNVAKEWAEHTTAIIAEGSIDMVRAKALDMVPGLRDALEL